MLRATKSRRRYRFRTKKEFVEKFGRNWRGKVAGFWIYKMDKFLGKECPSAINNIKRYRTMHDKNYTWTISFDMVVEILPEPVYNLSNVKREKIFLRR